MLVVSFFTGGTIQYGPCRVQYSKGPTKNFTANDDISFGELEVELYRWMGISRSTHNISITSRFHNGMNYSELQILNNAI
jgi:hypothetical protein